MAIARISKDICGWSLEILIHSYMHRRRKVQDHLNMHRLKLLAKHSIFVNFKILGIGNICLLGTIRDWVKKIQKLD